MPSSGNGAGKGDVVSGDTELFADRLRDFRHVAGLTQDELATRSGLSVRAVRDLERGRTRWPYRHSLYRLADALELTGLAREEFIAAAGRRLSGAGRTISLQATTGQTRDGVRTVIPRQLPAALPGFVGRQDQLAALSRVLHYPAGAALISAIGGTAGVGKTALAVQWAHEVAAEFPDGQLFVNLRGFDPSGSPVTPAHAVRVFLDALAVPADRIPQTVEGQLGLYRSLLVGKRILVVLDNARDAAQVRPLLPGAPTCRALITSRVQLTGLAATEAAHLLALDVMTDAEAQELLLQRLGASRYSAEPGAIAQIIECTARLPLAICIIGARAAAEPSLALEQVAASLAAPPDLDAFADGKDSAADVRATLSWSYRQLDDRAARLFRLLGVHPGPDVTVAAAASLAGTSPAEAHRLLNELSRACLLADNGHGRYSFHDLLRAYATERARASEDSSERTAALRRTLDHYLATAAAALIALNGRRLPADAPPLAAGVAPEAVTTRSQALEWFDREYAVLLRLIVAAAAEGFDTHAWQLPWLLASIFEYRARWLDWESTHGIALAAAERLGDRRAMALIHNATGRCAVLRRQSAMAEDHFRQALHLFEALGDIRWQAHAYVNLGVALHDAGRPRDAIPFAQQAFELYRDIGDGPGQAGSLSNIGYYSLRLGDYERGQGILAQALATYRDLGDPSGQAIASVNLGLAHQHLGEYDEAIACLRAAVALFDDMGHAAHQAEALSELGATYHESGRPAAAAEAWQQAVAIYEELGHPAAAKVRESLTAAIQQIGIGSLSGRTSQFKSPRQSRAIAAPDR